MTALLNSNLLDTMKTMIKKIAALCRLCKECEALVWRLGTLISLMLVVAQVIANHR